MKYVMFRDRGTGMVTPVFTCAPITHADLARALKETHDPVSAGFVEFYDDCRCDVMGYSTSLNLRPAATDVRVIEASVRATLSMVPQLNPLPENLEKKAMR